MRNILAAVSLVFPLLITTAYSAEFNMRPGLWEITTTSDLLLLTQHIPPSQMKSIKDLANQYGFDMPEIEHGAAISKTCITQEMANKKTLPIFYQEELGCASKNTNRNGNHFAVSFTCNSADLKGNGAAVGNLTSPERFIGQTQFKGLVQGVQVNEKADVDGKWMSASCGSVKPM